MPHWAGDMLPDHKQSVNPDPENESLSGHLNLSYVVLPAM